MKVKLQNFSKSNQLLLLDVLDYLVDKGNMIIWSSISSKKFFQSLLDLLRTKDIPEVQMKLLGLIQKWGLNFEDKKNVLPNFVIVMYNFQMILNQIIKYIYLIQILIIIIEIKVIMTIEMMNMKMKMKIMIKMKMVKHFTIWKV